MYFILRNRHDKGTILITSGVSCTKQTCSKHDNRCDQNKKNGIDRLQNDSFRESGRKSPKAHLFQLCDEKEYYCPSLGQSNSIDDTETGTGIASLQDLPHI